MMKANWFLAGGCALALAALTGCNPNSSPEPTQPGPTAPAPLPGGPMPRGRTGPLKLGMTEEEVRHLPDVTVQALPENLRSKVEGVSGPALRITRFGQPIALVELQDGTVHRIRFFTPNFSTPEGGRVGMRAQELGKLYGMGRLDRVSGGLCARFDRAPEERFCFAVPNAGNIGSWDQLLARNPRVKVVIVSKLLPPRPRPAGPGGLPSGSAVPGG